MMEGERGEERKGRRERGEGREEGGERGGCSHADHGGTATENRGGSCMMNITR